MLVSILVLYVVDCKCTSRSQLLCTVPDTKLRYKPSLTCSHCVLNIFSSKVKKVTNRKLIF